MQPGRIARDAFGLRITQWKIYWKLDSTEIVNEGKGDQRGWFRVMCHTADFYNHQANCSNAFLHSPRLNGRLVILLLDREL